MKKIIVPTDFSENALDAMRYLIQFLGDSDAKVRLIHVLEPYVPSSEVAIASTNLFQMHLENAKQKMTEFVDNITTELPLKENIKLYSEVLLGNITNVVKENAISFEADFILMGTRGENYSTLDKWLGTTSSLMIEHAPCPLMLIPANYKYQAINNVVFSTDFRDEDPFEIWKTAEILKPHQVVIQCVNVVKDDEGDYEKSALELKKYMEEHNSAIQTVFNSIPGDDVAEAIAEYADNYDAEMIAMTRTNHSAYYRMLHGSETKKMISHLHIPLLILHSKK